MIINLILWAILGAITLWMASIIIGGERSRGVNFIICTIGIVAGEIVMLVMNAVTGAKGFSISGFFIALIGAFVLLMVLHYSCNGSGKKKYTKKRPYSYNRGQDTYEM